jgi:hypothetical protein
MSNCFLTALKSSTDSKSMQGAIAGLELVLLDSKKSALTLLDEHEKMSRSDGRNSSTQLSLVDDLRRIIDVTTEQDRGDAAAASSSQQRLSVPVRQAAVRVLGCLHVLHDTPIIRPHTDTIINILARAVEDRKRLVRREAAKAHSVWIHAL